MNISYGIIRQVWTSMWDMRTKYAPRVVSMLPRRSHLPRLDSTMSLHA